MEKLKKYKYLVLIILIILIVCGASYFGVKQYQKYQTEKIKKENITQETQKQRDSEVEKLKQEVEALKNNKLADKPFIPPTTKPVFFKTETKTTEIHTTSEIVSQNKKFIVLVFCQVDNGTVRGSGIVIGKTQDSIIVLTNYHVTKYAKTPPAGVPPCFIDAGENGSYYAKPVFWPNVASQETMELVDFSFLQIKEPLSPTTDYYDQTTGKSGVEPSITKLLYFDTFPKICPLNIIKAGEDIIVLGYPAIGGGEIMGMSVPKLTITEGIISDEVSSFDTYFVSSAKIEQGNSGGGAFLNSTGCLAGMPTFSKIGAIESLARLINLANLKENYLNHIWNNL